MPQVQTLRAFVQKRLSAAAEEIFEMFERTIAEYEETLCRQGKLLDAVLKPQVLVSTAGDPFPVCETVTGCGAEFPELKEHHKYEPKLCTDVQLLSVVKVEDSPEPQEWKPSLDQNGPPELSHIKDEQEEVWTSQEGLQHHELEEDHNTNFIFTAFHTVKIGEDDEEKPQSPHLHHTEEVEIEADGGECGGPEPHTNFNLNNDLQSGKGDETSQSSKSDTNGECSGSSESDTDDETSSSSKSDSDDETSSESETEGRCDWKEIGRSQSGLNPRCFRGKPTVSSSKCVSSFGCKRRLQDHNGIQTEVKPYSCSVCGKTYTCKSTLRTHTRLHSEENKFSCLFCPKTFPFRAEFMRHLRVHTGEKPFSCMYCGKRFTQKGTLTEHIRIHTGEKPYNCFVCGKSFIRLAYMKQHKCVGERSPR